MFNDGDSTPVFSPFASHLLDNTSVAFVPHSTTPPTNTRVAPRHTGGSKPISNPISSAAPPLSATTLETQRSDHTSTSKERALASTETICVGENNSSNGATPSSSNTASTSSSSKAVAAAAATATCLSTLPRPAPTDAAMSQNVDSVSNAYQQHQQRTRSGPYANSPQQPSQPQQAPQQQQAQQHAHRHHRRASPNTTMPPTGFAAPPAPRHALPQPRSSTLEGHSAARHASPHSAESTNIRTGAGNAGPPPRGHASAAPRSSSNTPNAVETANKPLEAAALHSSSTAAAGTAADGNPLNARLSKRANANQVDSLDNSVTGGNNNNSNNTMSNGSGSVIATSDGSSGPRRRTSGSSLANTSGGTTSNPTLNPASSNNGNNNGPSMSSDAAAAAAAAALRHLQPTSNHSRVNLFVRDLPLDLKEDQLRAMFSPFGEIVNSAIMRNIHTGVSLGTAFVRFSDHPEAMKAMEAFAGGRAMAGSKRVTVQWARREHDKAPSGDERKRMRKLFIRNVPKDVSQEMLTQLFAQFGPVKTVSTHRDTAAANAVSQPGGLTTLDGPEQGLDMSMSAASLTLNSLNNTNGSNTMAALNNNNTDDRRIAFITFDVEGVAERATAAIHNTMPFPSCNGIPLMVKLAEDTPVRHSTNPNHSSNLNSTNPGNPSTNTTSGGNGQNPNFTALGAMNSNASATVSASNVAHPFSVSAQPSSHGVNWAEFPANDYLHSPSMSPPAAQLMTGVGAPGTTSAHNNNNNNNNNAFTTPMSLAGPAGQGGSAAGAVWHNTPNASPQGTQLYMAQGAAGAANVSGVAPALTAPRTFNAANTSGGSVMLNAGPVAGGVAAPTTLTFTTITPMNSNNTGIGTYTLQNVAGTSPAGAAGPGSLRQHPPPPPPPPPAASATSASHGGYPGMNLGGVATSQQLTASPAVPLSLNPNGPSTTAAPQQTLLSAPGALAGVSTQASLQDIGSMGYLVSGSGDLYAFPGLSGASPEMLTLASGGMTMMSYEPQDYYALNRQASTHVVTGGPTLQQMPFRLQQPLHQQQPQQPQQHRGSVNSVEPSPRGAPTSSLSASPKPSVPSPGTFSFSQISPRGGHTSPQLQPPPPPPQPPSAPTSYQPSTTTTTTTNVPSTGNNSNSNNGSSALASAAPMPPVPRSVAAAAAAAAKRTSPTPSGGALTAAVVEPVSMTLSAAHSDLAANHHSRAGRRGNGGGGASAAATSTATNASAASAASLKPANPELASSFSSTSTGRFQPYDMSAAFGAGARQGWTQNVLSSGQNDASTSSTTAANHDTNNSNNSGATAGTATGPGSLRTAPPTLPSSLPLPPSGSPTAPARPYLAHPTQPSATSGIIPNPPPSTVAGTNAAGARAQPFVPPLDPHMASFDYDVFKDDTDTDAANSQVTSAFAAEVLRAVTEGADFSPAPSPTAGARVASSNAQSRGRRRSLTGPSSMFARKDSSDEETTNTTTTTAKTSAPSSTGRTGTNTRSSKPMSLTMGAPALLEEQLLYQWDGTAADTMTGTTTTTHSTSAAGAIGSQAASPVAGAGHQKNHPVLSFVPAPSPSMTQDLTGASPDTAASVSNFWLTSDVSGFWASTQMRDPVTLLPEPPTTATNATAAAAATASNSLVNGGGVYGEMKMGNAHALQAGGKSPSDVSRRSTARTLPGTTAPPLPVIDDDDDDDDEQTGWGTYPDLALNLSWDATPQEEASRRQRHTAATATATATAAPGAAGLDPLLYGQQMNDDAERLYNFMSYDDASF